MFQRVRNRFTIFGVAGLVVGVGVSLVFSFAPNLVTESTARVLIYVGFGLMVLGVALFIYGLLKTQNRRYPLAETGSYFKAKFMIKF